MPMYPAMLPSSGVTRVERGALALTLLTLGYNVTFTQPMPDTNYDVGFLLQGLALNVSSVVKRTDGFSIGLAVGLSGTVRWLAAR